MRSSHIASAFIAASACALLAASCARSPASQPIEPTIETTDDEGDFGTDPDTSGNIGAEPTEPNYSWSLPSGDTSPGDGDSDSNLDPDTSGGGYPMPIYTPGSPVHSPRVMPLAPCEAKCQEEYETVAAVCCKMENQAESLKCQEDAYAKSKGCRENCGKKT
jgi:hypothetical protein